MSPLRLRLLALLALAIVALALAGMGGRALLNRPGVAGGSEVEEQEPLRSAVGTLTGSCGVERWSVKTGTDADAGSVNLAATTPTTIASLRALPAPSSLPSNNRVAPTEDTVFSLDATLYEYKLETDSDYHLVLEDPSGSTMIGEIPDPGCVGAGSPFASSIAAARSAFDAQLHATSSFQTASIPVHLTGVGFFDVPHGQTGVAPNAIELHPLLSISFGGATGGSSGPAGFHPLAPTRILDTRSSGPVGPGGTANLQVAGVAGIPSSATAVVMNVTATDTTADGYLTVYPAGVARPLASNLNWKEGQTVPNLAVVQLGSSGAVSIFNAFGSTDVVADVTGWLEPQASGSASGLWNPLNPARLLDTRAGAPAGPGGTIPLQVTGAGGVPPGGVSAVALNVTVTNPTVDGFLTVYPAGGPLPLASNLNFTAGETVPNRVVVPVGAGGAVDIYNLAGTADVVVDVSGWFTDGTAGGTGSTFSGVAPSRLLDTRDGTGGYSGQLGPGGAVSLQVSGRGGVPDLGTSTPPGSAILNVTVTDVTAGAYLTAWPDQWPRPLASDLNYTPGATVANLVLVGLGPDGRVDILNSAGCSSVVVDVVGWFSGPPASPAVPASTPVVVACPPPPSPPPAPPPAALSVSITASQYGYVAATTSPGATCSAKAVLPSGNVSQASGLQVSKTADGAGNVSWTYGTSSLTQPGTGTHTVTCTLNGVTGAASAPFTVS